MCSNTLDAPPRFRVKQLIFNASSPAGENFALAALADGRCAILQGPRLVDAWDEHPRGVDAAVAAFILLTATPRRLAAPGLPRRHPAAALVLRPKR